MMRWVVPVLCSLGIHVALFNVSWETTPPAYAVSQNRAVTISLEVLAAPEPVAPLPAPRVKAVQPLKPLAVAKPPEKKKKIAPKPPAPTPAELVESPAPVPEKDRPAVSNDAAAQTPGPDPMPDEQAMAVDRGASNAPERSAATAGSPQVTASVPLYALNPAPAYPTVARRRNYQGTVFLNVRVDRQGRAVEVEVQQSSGYAVLDQSAVKSVRQWRFEPARRAGQPIDMWVRVPVRFALE